MWFTYSHMRSIKPRRKSRTNLILMTNLFESTRDACTNFRQDEDR
ncbi:hypothetical protein Pint_25741 [Pistacia integerrima]|uniref:Uncharacterized protein n=1 Tax=Pistacia integerrima TaxID=434235 RepID=A0ACC0YG25_9ROSI|nr:hypothetical protein Pint_25741 [Pistacia integerrima]